MDTPKTLNADAGKVSVKVRSDQTTKVNRRTFLGSTSTAILAAGAFPSIIASSVLGKDDAFAPSNRITLGVIGCGPQGLGDMGNFLHQKDCHVVAVCDVKQDRLGLAQDTVNKHYENKDCRVYHDFRELISRKDIDACLIATPDHWHVLAGLGGSKFRQGHLSGETAGGDAGRGTRIAQGRPQT